MTQRFALAHHPFHFFCALCSPISTILALIMRTKETKACVFNSNSAVHLFLSSEIKTTSKQVKMYMIFISVICFWNMLQHTNTSNSRINTNKYWTKSSTFIWCQEWKTYISFIIIWKCKVHVEVRVHTISETTKIQIIQ